MSNPLFAIKIIITHHVVYCKQISNHKLGCSSRPIARKFIRAVRFERNMDLFLGHYTVLYGICIRSSHSLGLVSIRILKRIYMHVSLLNLQTMLFMQTILYCITYKLGNCITTANTPVTCTYSTSLLQY